MFMELPWNVYNSLSVIMKSKNIRAEALDCTPPDFCAPIVHVEILSSMTPEMAEFLNGEIDRITREKGYMPDNFKEDAAYHAAGNARPLSGRTEHEAERA